MITVNENLLQEMTRRLVETFHPERIYLFGSHAWGKPGPDSDVDLMVVVKESEEAPAKRDVRGYRALSGMGVPKDIIVQTRAEFERYLGVPSALETRIVNQGRLLYDSETVPG